MLTKKNLFLAFLHLVVLADFVSSNRISKRQACNFYFIFFLWDKLKKYINFKSIIRNPFTVVIVQT